MVSPLPVLKHTLKKGERESRRLSCPGCRLTDHVTTGKEGRYRIALDRRGFFVTQLGQDAQELRLKAE